MAKSNFTPLSADLNVIQKLDDLPNAVGGLSADQLKAKFDEAVNVIKAFINLTLMGELASETSSSSGASKIGIEPVVGLTGVTNLQDAISGLLDMYTAGTVADGSVTTIKLGDDAVTAAKIDDGAVGTPAIADSSVTGAKCDFSGGLTIAGNLNQQGELILDSHCFGNTTSGETPTAGRIFFVKL